MFSYAKYKLLSQLFRLNAIHIAQKSYPALCLAIHGICAEESACGSHS